MALFYSRTAVIVLIMACNVSIVASKSEVLCPPINGGITSKRQHQNGPHFIVGIAQYAVVLSIKVNSSGCITDVDGVAPSMLEWIAEKLQFTYSFLHIKDTSYDPVSPPELPGIGHYLLNEMCDFVIGGVAYLDPKWTRLIKLSDGYLQRPNAYIIPMPTVTISAFNVFRPFQWQTWLCIFSSLLIISLTLNALINKHNSAQGSVYVFQYVIGVLLNQGGSLGHQRLISVTLTSAAWCLSALVLTSAYSTLMTSLLATPDVKPLIDFTEDLTNRPQPNIKIIVRKSSAIEQYISGATEGVYKQQWDMITSYPKGRCDTVKECVDLVKSGNHVYMAGAAVAFTALYDDFHSINECNLAFARRKSSMQRQQTWSFRNGVHFFGRVNIGIMQLKENGLIDYWLREHQPSAQLCIDKAKKLLWRGRSSEGSSNLHRLTLVNVFGAFLVLLIGYFVSAICFLIERTRCHF